jgi:FtsP/CotA-like multicopper oxidase with cupredoxin domain
MNNDLDGCADGTAQLLMALAERADVIVDFRGLANGAVVELLNIGPDEPFGGGIPGVDFDPADPNDSGKVMRFVVNTALNGQGKTDPFLPNGKPNKQAATEPANLVLNAEPALPAPTLPDRAVSLNELDSEQVCVIEQADGSLVQAFDSDTGNPLLPEDCTDSILGDVGAEPFGPLEALLGTVDLTTPAAPAGIPLKWTDDSGIDKLVPLVSGATVRVNVTENPALGAIENWDIYNFTMDAHPIHLHLVRFAVVERRSFGATAGTGTPPEAWETGFKDTVISYPGEITTVRALFDIEGLYVWHCHIVEHEDNEMMRPYAVGLVDAPPLAP